MAKTNGSDTTANEQEIDDLESLVARIAKSTISGDVRNLILDELKHHQKNPLPWNMRSEGEQFEIANRVSDFAATLVRQVVRLVAGDGRRTIGGTLEQFTAKDGIKATIQFPSDDNTMLALNHARGASILVVVSDAAPYLGESEPVEINPDQSSMLPDEGGEAVAA